MLCEFFIAIVECSKHIYVPFPGPDLGLDLAQGLGPADAAIARAHAAAATAGKCVGNCCVVHSGTYAEL